MDEGAENEERVDLEEEYSEDMDDDVEPEGIAEGSDVNIDKGMQNLQSGFTGKDRLLEEANNKFHEESEIDNVSISDEDIEKHAQILALPPHGSEIFVGGLPRDATEEDLGNLCDFIGEVHEIRVVKKKDTGENKGYAFISFKTREDAQKSVTELHGKEIKGKMIRCSLSESKHRLFVGNIPKSLTEEIFRKAVEGIGPGIDNIDLIKDPQNPGRNRGFAFVEYYNNACADYARQKMSNSKFKLDGNTPTVSWADPRSVPDQSAIAQVKAVHVKNIPEDASSEHLKELFERYGEVTKVILPSTKAGQTKRDFAFVHYAERSSALKAAEDDEKHEMLGRTLEVSLAKPQTEKKIDGAVQNAGSYSGNVPLTGYCSLSGNSYSSFRGHGVTAGFQQPVIYGRGPMPAGMQMVPMILPDGRVGYVLQQPGVQMSASRLRSERNGSSYERRGHGRSEEGGRSRRYRPY